MRLREDEILRSNGQKGIYTVAEKDDAAIVLPMDGGLVWLVEQYRYTIQQRALELPQGSWEQANADPEELARGELREETGLHAEQMTQLGALWIAYGFTHQRMHVFMATGLSQRNTDRDAEEHDLVVKSMPVEEFERMMQDGTIADSCTVAAWGLYLLWKARQAASVR